MALNRGAGSWSCPSSRTAPDALVSAANRMPVSDGTLIHFIGPGGGSQAYTPAGVRQAASDVSAGTGAPSGQILVGAALVSGFLYCVYRNGAVVNQAIYRRPWTAGSNFTVWSSNGNRGLICADSTYVYTSARATPNDFTTAVSPTAMNRIAIADGSVSTWGSPDNAFRSNIFTDGNVVWVMNPWGITAHAISNAARIAADSNVVQNQGPRGVSGTQTNGGWRGGMCAVGGRYFCFLDTFAREYSGVVTGTGADTVAHLAPAPAGVMNLRLGDATPDALYLGDTRIRRAYLGDVEVWNDPA